MTKIEQKEEEIALELEGLISKDNPNLLKSLENMMLEYKQLIREEDQILNLEIDKEMLEKDLGLLDK